MTHDRVNGHLDPGSTKIKKPMASASRTNAMMPSGFFSFLPAWPGG